MRAAAVAALWLLAPLAGASIAPSIPSAEQVALRSIRGAFDNALLVDAANPPVDVSSSAAIFGGHVSPLASAPSGTGGQGQEIRLLSSAFAQPVARDLSHPDLAGDAIRRTRILLYHEARFNAGLDPTEAAFRYLVQLYQRDPDAGDAVAPQFDSMDALWTEADREIAFEAERILRDAIKHAPTDFALRHNLLDIFFYRSTADLIIARSSLIGANEQRLFPRIPGDSTLDNEIAAYQEVLPRLDMAFHPYGAELFLDPLGVDVARYRPDIDPNTAWGGIVFQEEQPLRAQFAATYLEGGLVQPVPGDDGQPIEEIFAGYKDLVLLYEILADQTKIAAEIARRLAMRSQGSDLNDALDLIGETHQRVHMCGTLLQGLFPDFTPDPGDASGLAAAIDRWETGLAELDATRQIFRGEANTLGFANDFLMLVQPYPPDNPTLFDSFDSLDQFIQENDTAPLTRALTLHQDAVDSYDSYRGSLDELDFQHFRQKTSREDRLFLIVGVRPGQPGFASPEENVGSDLWQQRQSIEAAKLRIRRNDAEIHNVMQQASFEVERRAKETNINGQIQDLYINFGNRQAGWTVAIAAIQAAQTFANEMVLSSDQMGASVGAPTATVVNVTTGFVGHQINAFVQAIAEVGKGLISAQKERLAAQQEAEINALNDMLLNTESKLRIKSILLELNTLAIDSLEAALLLTQEEGRRVALYDEMNDHLNQLELTEQRLSERYFADPIHQLRFQDDTVRATHAFEEAQVWVYYLTRALEYKWNQPFAFTTTGGQSFDSGSVFRARNALDLAEIVAAMESYDAQINAPRQLFADWFSLRDDVYGYIPGPGRTYPDPLNPDGPEVGGVRAFRHQLELLADGGDSLTIRFDTTSGNLGGNLFLGPVFDENGDIFLGFFNDTATTEIYTTVAGQLTQGGSLLVRDPSSGDFDPMDPSRLLNEFTAYTSRFWFNTGSGFQFTEALTTPVTMRLTMAPETPPEPIHEITVFRERSVAATDWRLLVNFRDGSNTFVDIDELDDIEIFFRHLAAPRQN
jgi:hypothetical protein